MEAHLSRDALLSLRVLLWLQEFVGKGTSRNGLALRGEMVTAIENFRATISYASASDLCL